jgi:hypothetical protein
VVATYDATHEQVYLLRDYSTLTRYWRVRCRNEVVVEVEPIRGERADAVHGMLERRTLAGRALTLGFLSSARHESVPNVPGYSQNLSVLINERLLGDGFAVPSVQFRPGFFKRDFTVCADDGWTFHIGYSAPWVHELIRKLIYGNTLDYDPADFIERLVEVIGFNRPQWIAGASER